MGVMEWGGCPFTGEFFLFNIGTSINRKQGKNREGLKEYLIKKGVDPATLMAKGFGEENPVASNSTPNGRRKNRRVEFKVKE